MPEVDGWHIRGFTGLDGRQRIWHYCEGAERDTLVLDNAEARRDHETECRQRLAALRAAEEEEIRRRHIEALAAANEDRKAERAWRNECAVADLRSGQYTEREVSEQYGLSVKHLRRLARAAA
jgi:hypothetical protein